MKARLLETTKKYLIVISVGLLYLLWIYCTDIKIPCPIKSITGYLCPACGITRMVVAICRFDFVAAYYFNPFLFATFPVVLFCIVYSDIKYIKTGQRKLGYLSYLLWLEIIAAIAFGILRNC